MYGTHINSLNVYLLNAGTTGLGNNIFRRQGNQGNKWIQGEVTIQTQPGYKVSLFSDKSEIALTFFACWLILQKKILSYADFIHNLLS